MGAWVVGDGLGGRTIEGGGERAGAMVHELPGCPSPASAAMRPDHFPFQRHLVK
jgi:hypothetical protein